jgi:acetyl-CoA synthetase
MSSVPVSAANVAAANLAANQAAANANLDIDSTLRENRVFPPPAEFAAKAHIKSLEEYEALYKKSIEDPEAFWAGAAEELHWFKRWDKVLDWNLPWAKWFVGGKLNLSYNCVDRHALGARRNKTAIIWEGEPGEIRRMTYAELHAEVQKFANALKGLGIKKGDRVAVYMGMTPELAIALLACARIGAVHSVIFGGFAATAIADRVNDSTCVAVLTQDSSYRRGGEIKLKQTVDEAMKACPTVKHVVVYKRTGSPVTMVEGRDHWWHDLMSAAAAECPAEEQDAEDPLYILYTSGTTGKPKGLVHTTGGYAVQTYLTTKYVFDLQEHDIYWCTADIGWVTGHSYVVYGPLQNGATVLMYEGAPNFPDFSRFWKIVDDHKVTIFYTAPTAIRAFIKWGDQYVEKHDLSSLRLLGTVGEPINPEAWMWYREKIGHNRCPIVDTWWQTETGRDLDCADTGGGADEAGLGDAAVLWDRAGGGEQGWASGSGGERRAAGGAEAVALDGADCVWRSGALREDVLERCAGELLHRRRCAAGCGRVLLADGARGRRDQRERAPAGHDGSGECAGGAPEGGRGRGGGAAGRAEGAGDFSVCFAGERQLSRASN